MKITVDQPLPNPLIIWSDLKEGEYAVVAVEPKYSNSYIGNVVQNQGGNVMFVSGHVGARLTNEDFKLYRLKVKEIILELA